jgi:hypothetical protein
MLSPRIFEGRHYFKNVEIMFKRYLLLLVATTGLFVLIHGCQSMAISMSDGEKLYQAKCSSCHNVIEPRQHDEETWRRYVEEYGKKMKTEEKQLVLRYLVGSD